MGNLLSIVINDNRMRIAELSAGRKGVTVSRLLTKEVPASLIEDGVIRDVRTFSDLLSSVLRNANIKAKRVVFSLPSDKIMTREVILPELDKEKIKTALKANASDYFPIDLADYVLAYFPISRIVDDGEEEPEPEEEEEEDTGKKSRKKKKKKNNKKKEKKRGGKKKAKLRLMVVAAPNEMVQSCYDVAKLAHLKLESIDYIGNSVFQLTANQIGEEPCLVIQLDEDHTVLTIYNENVMLLQRNIDFGSASIVQAVMDKKQISYEQAEADLESRALIHRDFDDGDEITDSVYYLVSNVKRVIEYYSGRNVELPLERIYVMGDGSAIKGLNELFEGQLYLPVESITALKQVFVKDSTNHTMKEVLRYMDNIGAVIAPVDFIPKQLEQDMRRKLEAKAYRMMILLALFASVIIVTIPAMEFLTVGMEAIDLENRLLVMEDVRPILENYEQAAARYVDVQEVNALTRTNNESLLDFIEIFEQLRPSNLSIQSFSCNEGQVSFSALAAGKKTVVKLIQQLNMIANVSEVKVSGLSSTFEGDQETVSFSVTCMLTNSDWLLRGGSVDENGQFVPNDQEVYDELEEETRKLYRDADGNVQMDIGAGEDGTVDGEIGGEAADGESGVTAE